MFKTTILLNGTIIILLLNQWDLIIIKSIVNKFQLEKEIELNLGQVILIRNKDKFLKFQSNIEIPMYIMYLKKLYIRFCI